MGKKKDAARMLAKVERRLDREARQHRAERLMDEEARTGGFIRRPGGGLRTVRRTG